VSGPVRIESAALGVTVTPEVGGTITEIRHKRLGSVLGTVPWQAETTPLDPAAVTAEPIWLTRFTGGWPLLFPNGCDACNFDGVFHGFHGEASITPWQVDGLQTDRLRLTRRFETVPVTMERVLSVADDVLSIAETVRMAGAAPIRVMWGQHATFGSDLLAAPFVIETGAQRVLADPLYDPPHNPLVPGGVGFWPRLPGKQGSVDLSRPQAPAAIGGCLTEFEAPWAAIRRLDDSLAAILSWDDALFPYAWLWVELGGTAAAPWHGKGHVIGLEPATTWPSNGLAEASRQGGTLLTLAPGQEIGTTVRLQVFKPGGPIRSVDPSGRAVGA
jgi:hypothetical protein